MLYYKWGLIKKVSDLVAHCKIDIVNSRIETSVKKVKMTYAALDIFNNSINYFWNRQGKNFAKPSNR